MAERDEKRVGAVETGAIREANRDRIRNERLKEMVNTEDTITDDIAKNQLIWH